MASSRLNSTQEQIPSSAGRSRRRSSALSCAECRRLKLKCSRDFPCSNCVKKGCGAICPDGSLTTGKGNRFVLANTEALHEKIELLSNRVRQLEDALAQVYSSQSRHQHPLLREDLLMIKQPLERESVDTNAPIHEADEEAIEVVDSLDSLAIARHGGATFFGHTANSWYFLQNEAGLGEEDSESPGLQLPTDIPWLSYTFPWGPSLSQSTEDVREVVYRLLPDPPRAQKLVDLYYRHAAWMYMPISEAEFYQPIFSRFYSNDISPDEGTIECHKLAVLYMVLALGSLLDLESTPHSFEAAQYYGLGRAALSIGSVFAEPSVTAIQALLLSCHFMFLSNIEGPRWASMGLVVKLAQSVGLHRDGGKWRLNPEETQQRRSLMWEIYTYDSWQSLTFGRPPSFALSHIDCQMAHDITKNDRGEIEMSFAAWKHRFSAECLSLVHDQVFCARAASYATLQKLHKVVSNFYVPPSLRVPGFGGTVESEPPSTQLTMQRYVGFAIKEITLFYMHRGFFARALEDNPEDPLSSKYGPSVLAAYNSARSFVGLIQSLYSQHPELTPRMWFLYSHVFSCAIVLGAIPTKCPGMAFTQSALSNLATACTLFEHLGQNPRAQQVLPILLKLKERALASVAEHQSNASPTTNRLSPGAVSVKDENDEWATLGGKSRLVSRKSTHAPISPSTDTLYDFHSRSPTSAGSPASTEPTPPPTFQQIPMPWQGYSTGEAEPYPSYTMPSAPWQDPAVGMLVPPNMAIDMPPPQSFPTYEPILFPKGAFVPQLISPVGAPLESGADVTESWRTFLAQFNHV
ncbi:hypothetical protein JAAARDRAFT_31102 [Jaapia argillacea MUCL 33604]|uniref:Zn(2)-C6 fungal-type domain-containing protein n=1 Tax=Jaapia argillacea MUCL 33604 TaxID=933084 RepID=A0A067QDQ2_9AGAM|nr:hypothetical protein JAAARDRAFT_31102 [Jaapia argillacea MUCL 33604]